MDGTVVVNGNPPFGGFVFVLFVNFIPSKWRVWVRGGGEWTKGCTGNYVFTPASRNFARCRHLLNTSPRLFRQFLSLEYFNIIAFSARHRRQPFPPGLYGGAVLAIDHSTDTSAPLSFISQTYSESAVSVLYRS